MSIRNWKELFFILSMIGIMQFAILTAIAMLFYTGGTAVNPNAPRYTFFENFFSDLGRTRSYSGKDNTVSYMIYTITLSVNGISAILFAIAMLHFFSETNLEKGLSIAGSFFWIIAGISVVGIAFTPSNVYSAAHLLFVFISSLTGLIGGILYIIVIFHNKEFPNIYAFIYIISITISIIMFSVWRFYAVPLANVSSTAELMVWTTGQKITIYKGLILGFIVRYGAWKQEKYL